MIKFERDFFCLKFCCIENFIYRFNTFSFFWGGVVKKLKKFVSHSFSLILEFRKINVMTFIFRDICSLGFSFGGGGWVVFPLPQVNSAAGFFSIWIFATFGLKEKPILYVGQWNSVIFQGNHPPHPLYMFEINHKYVRKSKLSQIVSCLIIMRIKCLTPPPFFEELLLGRHQLHKQQHQ